MTLELKIVRGACPHDCPDTCAMLFHVEDGKLVDVKGDPNHPMIDTKLTESLAEMAANRRRRELRDPTIASTR